MSAQVDTEGFTLVQNKKSKRKETSFEEDPSDPTKLQLSSSPIQSGSHSMPTIPKGLNESRETFLDRMTKEMIYDHKNLTEYNNKEINLFITIDNLKEPYSKYKTLKQEIAKAKPNLKFYLYENNNSGFIIEPKEEELYRSWPKSFCGGTFSIHNLKPQNNLKQFCLGKVNTEYKIPEIEQILKENNILPFKITRGKNKMGGDNTLIIFETISNPKQKSFKINDKEHRINFYDPHRNAVTRCLKCQKFGHKTQQCNPPQLCKMLWKRMQGRVLR